MDIFSLLLVVLLLILTAFFVATEFAVVKVRPTRIEQLIQEGNKNAIAAQKVITNLDEYLSACQLGITVTALGLGWLGEPTVEHMLRPVLEYFNLPLAVTSVISFTLSFVLVTFLHVVLGELAPKTMAIHKAEQVTLAFAKPIIWFYRIAFPFIWVLNNSARLFLAMFGVKPASEHEEAHSEEEIQILLNDSLKSGEINESEYEYVKSIFEFDELTAKDIMVPRKDMMVVDIEASIDEVFTYILEEKYTRYPVIENDKDHVVGFINSKEISFDYIRNKGQLSYDKITHFVRPVLYVHEATELHDVLVKMQKEQSHLAIVLDDHGGTSGLLTVEDILEEIVGEIRDEYDSEEVPDIQVIVENHEWILDGKVLLTDVAELLEIPLEEDDIDTIGGWILSQDIKIEENETLPLEHFEITILEKEGKSIKSIQVTKKADLKEDLYTDEQIAN